MKTSEISFTLRATISVVLFTVILALSTKTRADTLKIALPFPNVINPYIATGTPDLLAGSLVLEPLGEYDPNGQLVPALATQIPTPENGGISSDGRSITWVLKKNIRWSDGTKLKAKDVAFSWKFCIKTQKFCSKPKNAEACGPITGCSAIDGFNRVKKVLAIGKRTVKVVFEERVQNPYIPFVGYTMPIIQKEQFKNCINVSPFDCLFDHFMPIGTGPFKIDAFIPGTNVFYSVNPTYRLLNQGKPFFGTAVINPALDFEAATRSVLETGENDYAFSAQLPPAVLDPLIALGNGVVLTGSSSNVEYISLNQTDPNGSTPPSEYNNGTNPNPFFFENENLTRALSLAIDRNEIAMMNYGRLGQPTCNMWNLPNQNSTNNDECLTQDIATANAILDNHGYLDTNNDGIREMPGGGAPLVFELVTSVNTVRQANQILLQGYWAQIGILVNMRAEPPETFFSFGPDGSDNSIWKFQTDMEMFTNGAASPFADEYLSQFITAQIPESENGWTLFNIARFANSTFDSLIEQLAQIPLLSPSRDAVIIQLNDLMVSYAHIPLILRSTASPFINSLDGVGQLNPWDSELWNVEEWYRKFP